MWNAAEHETEEMYFLHVLDELSDTVDAATEVLGEMALAEKVVKSLEEVASCIRGCRAALDDGDQTADLGFDERGHLALDESDRENLESEAESLCNALTELQESDEDLPDWAMRESSDRMSKAVGELLRFHLDPVVEQGFKTYHILLRAA